MTKDTSVYEAQLEEIYVENDFIQDSTWQHWDRAANKSIRVMAKSWKSVNVFPQTVVNTFFITAPQTETSKITKWNQFKTHMKRGFIAGLLGLTDLHLAGCM